MGFISTYMLFITTCVCAVSVSAVDVLRQFMRVCVCAVSVSLVYFIFTFLQL